MANKLSVVAFALAWSGPATVQAQGAPLPIIDMHLHAATLEEFGGGGPACVNRGRMTFGAWDPRGSRGIMEGGECEVRVPASPTNAAVMAETIALLDRLNIWGVTTGPLDRVTAWRSASPRIIPSLAFTDRRISPEEYRRLYAEGRYLVFGEITAQYRGLSLADSLYIPYFALAEELDIPVGVHLGEGPPGGAHMLGGDGPPSTYRVRLGSPLQLEEILVRFPRLRIYVMHYGSPLMDEMIAMLFSHPQLYVDVAQNNWGFPREHFYSQLKRLIDAGFEDRILFGSDQMIWPQTIEVAIETINNAPLLSSKQKRDILYNNAARFLRLTAEEQARQHAGR